ncbi:unnamed protein product [Darwinula stevensoni]|uniref:COMM domain-containing protein n=1 Tax=Darwinula stevensoni TaxID=69355 RepID=A0A7R8X648_9CRUS|nr:unnamed protein product [Darwinula stevensoni]CAG0881091.1 unnamed protein product [Darwinula stevensoni]
MGPMGDSFAGLINEMSEGDLPNLILRVLDLLSHQVSPSIIQTDKVLVTLVFKSTQYQTEEVHLQLSELAQFFKKAIFVVMKPSALEEDLRGKGVDEKRAKLISNLWNEKAHIYILPLKNVSTASKQLEDVRHELRVTSATNLQSQVLAPCAILEFNLRNSEQGEKFHVQFSHEELFSLYNQLERMQEHLDKLY